MDLDEVSTVADPGRTGMTALGIVSTARRYGLRGRGVRLDPGGLRRLPPGSILHWGTDHFVVLERCHRRGLTVMDPAQGRVHLDDDEVDDHFTGVALLFDAGPDLEPRSRPPGRFDAIASSLRRHRRQLVAALALAGCYEVALLAMPVLQGRVVGKVVEGDGASVASAVLLACIGMALTLAVAHIARGRVLLGLRQQVDLHLTSDAVTALLAKPLAYFEMRNTGDLLMRLNGVAYLRDVVLVGFLRSVLDLVTLTATIVVLTTIEPAVGLAAAAATAIVLVPATVHARRVAAANGALLRARGEAQGRLVQLLRSAEMAKSGGIEQSLGQDWIGGYTHELDAMTRLGVLQLDLEAVSVAVVAALPPLLLLVAGVANGWQASQIGEMVAIAGVAAVAVGPVGGLSRSIAEFAVMRGHLDRLTEFSHGAEAPPSGVRSPGEPLAGTIRLEGVRYCPAGSDQPIIEDATLQIDAGEVVAIMGSTGSGKTTLGKLIGGLYPATEGRVIVGGLEITDTTLQRVREHLGVVTQAPYLLPGTLASTIEQLTDRRDPDVARWAASVAGLDDDLARMPRGLATVIGEDGAPLSGGQRQRLALARAIARRPSILLLDEATNQLDEETEAQVVDRLRTLGCTVVLVTHSSRVAARCDRVIQVRSGQVAASDVPATR